MNEDFITNSFGYGSHNFIWKNWEPYFKESDILEMQNLVDIVWSNISELTKQTFIFKFFDWIPSEKPVSGQYILEDDIFEIATEGSKLAWKHPYLGRILLWVIPHEITHRHQKLSGLPLIPTQINSNYNNCPYEKAAFLVSAHTIKLLYKNASGYCETSNYRINIPQISAFKFFGDQEENWCSSYFIY